MNLGDLRNILATHYSGLPDSTEVFVLSDEEGNQIHALNWVGVEKYCRNPEGYGIDLVHPDDEEDYVYSGYTLHEGLTLWP